MTEWLRSRNTTAVVGWGNARAVVVVVAAVMFAAQLGAAQQVVLKAGRLPRVYNALITTDQRLLPSQAEPIVMPVFRPFQFLYEWPQVRYAAAPSYPSSMTDVEVSGTDDRSLGQDESRPVASVVSSNGPADATVVKNNRPADIPVVKNNRPADSSVPDVPPPPLPVTRGQNGAAKKRPDEYPPMPGGFAI